MSRSLVTALLIAAASWFCPGPAGAATFTVSNTSNTGAGSLRQALTDANTAAGLDTVQFSIPGAGPHSIVVSGSPLPNLTSPVLIDGYTQPGSSVNTSALVINTQLRIELTTTTPGAASGLFFLVGSSGSSVRGLAINRFSSSLINATACDDCVFTGNFLGTDITGTTVVGGGIGVQIGSDRVRVGGPARADRNLISGLNLGVSVSGNEVVIQGNLIGSNADLSAPLANVRGLSLGATNPAVISLNGLVGGTNIGSQTPRNFIVGNTGDGILLQSGQGYRIHGNFIGLAGLSPMGNGGNGIRVSGGRDHDIGATGTGNFNAILFNGRAGVLVSGPASATDAPQGVQIVNNNIASNTGLAIDLTVGTLPDGVTVNDALDPDIGANTLQNFPELTGFTVTASETRVRGRLDSAVGSYRIDLYTSTGSCHPSGHGNANTLRVSTTVSVPAAGSTTFEAVIPEVITTGFAAATATRTNDFATSEFSRCLPLGDLLFANGFEVPP